MGFMDFFKPPSEAGTITDLDAKYGFRDLKFDSDFDSNGGFLKIGEIGDGGLIAYSRPLDSLRIGEADLSGITYSFYRNKFHSVHLNVVDEGEFNRLAEVLLKAYGRPQSFTEGVDTYLWQGALTSIFLDWDFARDSGVAVIGSTILKDRVASDKDADATRGVADL
jgi:hypothetical protein